MSIYQYLLIIKFIPLLSPSEFNLILQQFITRDVKVFLKISSLVVILKFKNNLEFLKTWTNSNEYK